MGCVTKALYLLKMSRRTNFRFVWVLNIHFPYSPHKLPAHSMSLVAEISVVLLFVTCSLSTGNHPTFKRTVYDKSVADYATQRVCWWNEACKKQFQKVFRCRCPTWAYCRSVGRYYEARCSVTSNGYIWLQESSPAIHIVKTKPK